MSDARDRVRLALARGHADGPAARAAAPVRRAPSPGDTASHDLPREDHEPEPRVREIMSDPVLIGRPTDAALGDELLGTTWRPRGRNWLIAFAITGGLTLMLFALIAYTVVTGIGVWGNMIPVAWAFGIINFVWWIGIGHAGTFISAILYLFEQNWRTSINRLAEAMTLFAVLQAALFPLLHLG